MTVIVNYRASHELVTTTSKQPALDSAGETFLEDHGGPETRPGICKELLCWLIWWPGLPIVIDIKCV